MFYLIGLPILIITCILGSVIVIRYYQRDKRIHMEKVQNIDYTQIIPTGGAAGGTKFLVVYLSGESELVVVDNNSSLCKEYLQKLKK